MYWLSFLLFSLVLYLPGANLAQRLWQWAAHQYWMVPGLNWSWPAWLAFAFWLAVAYLSLGTVLHLVHRRLPPDNRLRCLAESLSQASLGSLGIVAPIVALAILLLAWPVLPAYQVMHGWHYAISVPVAALAALYLLAETLRLAEHNRWADRAFAAWRLTWLIEHGHDR